jgi:ATP-dependent Clp protease ATP-binding subunit ClpA
VRQIAAGYLEALATTLGQRNRELIVEPEVLDALADQGHSLAYGARFLKRVIDDKIKLPLSQRWNDGVAFRVAVSDGEIVVESDESPCVSAGAGPSLAL